MNHDWIVYCDICGQRVKGSKSTELSTYTGRGGLVVCTHDVDKIDYGLVPFVPRKEQNPPFVRINHTNTENATPLIDTEDMSYVYYLASSQDNYIITSSQDDAWIQVNVPV